ncbi:Phosphoenolpyruvate carboxykinase [ATP] [Sphingomonas paucimobilis]|nr:Phosphoenolpyruvate carboxykinase [ATP] [Sphingomonas paucimobilis]
MPRNIVMLTADAYGILPPIAKLTPEQAMYHFLSGYTARVAGTEIGVTEPDATFSTCFGAPFMPRHPSVYGNLLKERIAKGGVDCWLVNTGWTGGKYGVGHRMPIKATRALLNAALDGSLNQVEFRTDPNFGFQVPVSVPGVDGAILNRVIPGPTRLPMTRRRPSWSICSTRISSNSPIMSTKASRVAAPKVTVAA